MAPKTTAPIAETITAYLEIPLNPASIAANTNLDVDITAPKPFKIGRPCFIQLKPGETALTLGLILADCTCLMVTGVKKIRVRFANNSAAAIDEVSKTYQIFQF